MTSYSGRPGIRRAQPWLGTLVSIDAGGLPQSHLNQAITAAFDEIATVHRLMSFHDPASDLSRLHRAAAGTAVHVHPSTWFVLEQALSFARTTGGCFDITVASTLVKWRLLPPPVGAPRCSLDHAGGSWQNIELLPGHQVVFHKPLLVDLGGIAKGFAVDQAMQSLVLHGVAHAVVNAGGDIRVHGPHAESIQLAVPSPLHATPVLALSNGSLAGSSGPLERLRHWGPVRRTHLDGLTRIPARRNRFVCVTAKSCMTADALTKLVMARGKASAHILQQCDASAYLHDPYNGWQRVGADGPFTA